MWVLQPVHSTVNTGSIPYPYLKLVELISFAYHFIMGPSITRTCFFPCSIQCIYPLSSSRGSYFDLGNQRVSAYSYVILWDSIVIGSVIIYLDRIHPPV